MQTILDLKKELINSGWWDIDERISSDGWGNGKIGYTRLGKCFCCNADDVQLHLEAYVNESQISGKERSKI